MNLILHQFKTDVRRFRVWLAGWWLSLVIGVVVSRWFVFKDYSGDLFALVTFFQVLLGVFLIAGVVQADPLVETTAFWLTRPLRRFHLSWSKTAFLIPLVFLPRR